MKHISGYDPQAGAVVQAAPLANFSTISPQDEETLALVKRLFAEFAVIFLHRWASVARDKRMYRLLEAKYVEALRGHAREDIARGLEAMPKGSEAWPPGAPAFAEYCRPPQAMHRPFLLALPPPRAEPELVRCEVARMREFTQGKGPPQVQQQGPVRFDSDIEKRRLKRGAFAQTLRAQGVPSERVAP